MPIYALNEEIAFPHPANADEDGLLAVGGDLSPERLLFAYSIGVYPCYGEGLPILWWSPDPRLVLFPERMHVSRSLRRTLRRRTFEVTMNRDFRAVMEACSRLDTMGPNHVWILPEMIEAYCWLHEMGVAHSFECRRGGEIVGGLYGLRLGRVFFGESMFAAKSDASKVALVHLCDWCLEQGIALIDCQRPTKHLISLGAEKMKRENFFELIRQQTALNAVDNA